MPDWTRSMQQTSEYYLVSPGTWSDSRRLDDVESCSITWDRESDLLVSASIDATEELGECYIRPYLVVVQDHRTEKFPMGTFLVQTPNTQFDGKRTKITMDAYSPLLELRDNLPPIGYTIVKGENIMDRAYDIANTNMRAPVAYFKMGGEKSKLSYDFTSNSDDNWLTFERDLVSSVDMELGLDDKCRLIFKPITELSKLRPVWTYDDGNSSILQQDITIDRDLYGIPNVVEVIFSKNDIFYYSRVENNDPNSPISTVNRGRVVLHRDTSPNISGIPTQAFVDEYARNLLESLSTLRYSVSYTHGFCPVRIGDCVRLDYKKAGLNNVNARVESQTINLSTGCQVDETATFINKLWEAK